AGQLRARRSAVSFAAGFAGSATGAAIVSQVDTATLRPLVIALLVAAALLVMMPRPAAVKHPRRPLVVAVAIALAIGFYDGFFGPGTGTLLIVGFMWLLAEDPAAASANAKVVNFASNLAAVIAFSATGLVLWSVSLPMAAGQFVGGWIGAHIVLTRGNNVVRIAAVGVALALVAKLTIDALA
ncbi:MAG: TSUP family transporter, partial [Deltaproteobacteria bacterium]|nr:TSUP family transporter [Kofleriaceae bacterium]